MTNAYYNVSGTPGFLTRAVSSQPRNESLAVQGGFDKLPAPSTLYGNAQNYYADTGTPNAIAITLNSNISGVYDGMELVVKVVAAPTGPATITATPTALANIVRFDNTPIQANDWVAGQFITLRYNATYGNYQYIPPFTGGATVAFPFTDSAPILKNAADGSKLLRFDLSPISASTTRVVTAPNRDVVLGIPFMDRVPRISNTQIVKANQGNIIDITSGAFTQTFAAPSTLGAGFNCYVQNSGTGDITIPLSDGITNWVMYPGEVRKFYVDETATSLKSVILNSFNIIVTSSKTFVKPPGYKAFLGYAWSAGAGGQRTNSTSTLSVGGGGGACFNFYLLSSLLGSSEILTIGAGGAGRTTVSTGGTGGSTSIGSILSIPGGQSGQGASYNSSYPSAAGNMNAIGHQGGITVGGADLINSEWGGAGSTTFNTKVISGYSIWGGAGGGSISSAGVIGTAGVSSFGGSGGAPSISGNGSDGIAPGGGGGATQTGTTSGSGARGEIRMWGVF